MQAKDKYKKNLWKLEQAYIRGKAVFSIHEHKIINRNIISVKANKKKKTEYHNFNGLCLKVKWHYFVYSIELLLTTNYFSDQSNQKMKTCGANLMSTKEIGNPGLVIKCGAIYFNMRSLASSRSTKHGKLDFNIW